MVDTAAEEEASHLYALFCGPRGQRVCGCGCPEDAWKLVLDLLEATAANWDDGGQDKGWFGRIPHPYDRLCGTSGSAHIVCGALEETGLLEHGGSFYGSWLTEEGRLYLELMRRHDYGEQDGTGYPHDSKGCPAGCAYRLPWMAADG